MIENEGQYQFRVKSQDSHWLSIDGVQVLENVGCGTKDKTSSAMQLSKGRYDFELRQTSDRYGNQLHMSYRGPDNGDSMAYITADAYASTGGGPSPLMMLYLGLGFVVMAFLLALLLILGQQGGGGGGGLASHDGNAELSAYPRTVSHSSETTIDVGETKRWGKWNDHSANEC